MLRNNEVIREDIENLLDDICDNIEFQADIDFMFECSEYNDDEKEAFYELFSNYEITWRKKDSEVSE